MARYRVQTASGRFYDVDLSEGEDIESVVAEIERSEAPAPSAGGGRGFINPPMAGQPQPSVTYSEPARAPAPMDYGQVASDMMGTPAPAPVARSVLDQPGPVPQTPGYDPMLNQGYVAEVRRDIIGKAAPEDRMGLLTTLAENRTDVLGRAARQILAEAQAENKRINLDQEGRAQRLLDAPRGPGNLPPPRPGAGVAPPPVPIPDVTPGFSDLMDGRSAQQIAERRQLAQGMRAADEGSRMDEVKRFEIDRSRTPGEYMSDLGVRLEQGGIMARQVIANSIDPTSSWAAELAQKMKAAEAELSTPEQYRAQQFASKLAQQPNEWAKGAVMLAEFVTNPTIAVEEVVRQGPLMGAMIAATVFGGGVGGLAVRGAAAIAPKVALADAISGGMVASAGRAAGAAATARGAAAVAAGGDAAGQVYEELTSKKNERLMQENADVKRLIDEGKTFEEARNEVALTKARLAQSIAATGGVIFGAAGFEGLLAKKIAGQAIGGTAKRAAAAELTTELADELTTQGATNFAIGQVDPNRALTQDFGQTAATTLVTTAPLAGGSAYLASRERGVDPLTDAYARANLSTTNPSEEFISPSQTARSAMDMGPSAPARNDAGLISSTLNFTPPDSITAQAGLAPIVVPTAPRAAGGTDVGLPDVLGGMAGGSGVAGGSDPLAGLGGAGRDPGLAGAGGGNAAGALAGDGGAALPGVGAPQPGSSLRAGRGERATDADLLARAEQAAGLPPAQPPEGAPAEIWAGRAGDGYAQEQDAQQALPKLQVRYPDLSWSLQQSSSGRFFWSGTTRGDASGTTVTGTAGQGLAATTSGSGAQQPSVAGAGVVDLGQGGGNPPGLPGGAATVGGAAANEPAFSLKLAPPAPLRAAGQAITMLKTSRGVDVELHAGDLTDQQKVASAMARLVGKTVTYMDYVAGPADQMPNGFVIPGKEQNIYLDSKSSDGALFVMMHEGVHALPQPIREKLVTTIKGLTKTDMRADFAQKFQYDINNESEVDNEIAAFMTQAVTKRPDFWQELRTKMGDGDFTEVAKVILDKLTTFIQGAQSAYGDDFIQRYATDAVAVRDAVSTAYADAMKAQQVSGAATTPATPGITPSNRVEQKNAAANRIEDVSADRFKRTPALQVALQDLQEGRITRDEYSKVVDEARPVYPYKELPEIATEKTARFALANGRGQSVEKAAKFGLPAKELAQGEMAQLRLDIPSYQEHDAWVVSVHRPKTTNRGVQAAYDAGPVVGYESVASITNATFGMRQSSALKIAQGTSKGTIATVLGEWKPITLAEAKVKAQAAMKSKDWTQVGMDPFRHSYFYDRDSMRPVVAADEVIQVGPLVLAKNAKFDDESDVTGAPLMFSNKGQEPAIGARLRERIERDYEGAAQEYAALKGTKGGRLLDTDMARELSPEYRENRNRAADVHSAASDFIQRTFEARMAQPGEGEIVTFMAGGGGSGKSSAEKLLAPVLDRSSTILDGTLSSYDKARSNVKMVLDSSRKVAIAYVYREPVEALRNGVLTRAMRGGRTVPLDALIKGHAGSSDVVRKLQAEFGGNPNFDLSVVDNSRGPGGAVLSSLESITTVTIEGLKERFTDATEDEYRAGRISEGVYRASIDRAVDAGAEAQGRTGVEQVQEGLEVDAEQGRGSEQTRDALAKPPASGTVGQYQYNTDAKGRVFVSGDAKRIKFLTKKIANGVVIDGGVRFSADDAKAAFKVLKDQPAANAEIARAVAEQLGLTPQEIASTSLEYQTGLPKDKAFVAPILQGIPEVVQFLEQRRRASGLRMLDIVKPEDQEILARLIAAETLAAIRSSGNALQWYDETIARTLAMAAIKYPELARDANAQMVFRLAMAITSQGLNVENNLKFTMRQYDAYRRTGRYPEVGEGDSSQAMVSNFKQANDLMDEMGTDLFRRFLVTRFTIGELNSAGFEPGGELVDEMVLGSSVFGPKIGFGFYSNLNGNFEPVTMDMWFMRTIGRLTGSLRLFDAEKFGRQAERFRSAFDERGSDGIYADLFDQALIDKARTDDEAAITLARLVKSVHEKDFKNNRAAYDAGTREKSKLVYAADTMIQSVDKPKDVPASGMERRQMREVVRKAVAEVERAYGQRVPPAAMQALIWYPEQELYKAMGVKLSVTSQDYAGATEKVLKDEGYDEKRLRAAAESGARGVRQANARDVGQAAKGTGQGARQSGPLQTGERADFLRARYERTELAKERLEPKRKGIVFEVAPDPNNESLTGAWRTLTAEQRRDISDRVAREIVPRVLAQFDTDGIITSQVGSYLDDTNPSFTLLLNKGDVVKVSKALGFVLAQDSMMVVSPKEFDGGEKNSALVIEVGDKTPAQIAAIYKKLRQIKVKGERPIGGQSYANGGMTILNYSSMPTSELAILVDQKLNKAYSILTRDVFAAFPEKKDYDYASETNDGRGSRAVLRQRARDLRAEASAALERELAGEGIQFSNRAGSDAAGGGRDRGVGQEDLQGSVTPSYGTSREGAASAVGYHYSTQPRTSLISGMFGTGLRGAEMERLRDADPRLKQRVYFYIDRGTGINPEAGVGGYAHRVNLQNLYDVDEDALRLRRDATGFNAFESAVIDAGFDGYMVRDAGPSGNAVLLGQHAVPVEQLGSAGRLATVDAVAPARDRVLNDAEKIAANKALPSGQVTGKRWGELISRAMPEIYERLADSPVWQSDKAMYRSELAKEIRDAAPTLTASNRMLPKVSPQSALEVDIARSSANLERAIASLRAGRSIPSKLVVGRLPHVLNMLGARTQEFDIASSIVKKVFVDKHQEDFGGVSVRDFVRAMYRPAMVLKSKDGVAREYEMVLPITGEKGAVIVPIKVSVDKDDPLGAVMSAYQKEVSTANNPKEMTVMKRVNDGNLLYVDPGLAKQAITGRKPGDARDGVKLNENFVSWASVWPKLEKQIANRQVKTDTTLMGWIGDNYKPSSSPDGWQDAPSFSNRVRETPESVAIIVGGRTMRVPDSAGAVEKLDAKINRYSELLKCLQ